MTLRPQSAVIGAYVADAATLGVHWLYSPPKLATLAAQRPLEFTDVTISEPLFAGSGYFAHGGKRTGELTHYGASLRSAVLTMAACGSLSQDEFSRQFERAFASGGWWVGYMDHTTKGTLANISAKAAVTGCNDSQITAYTKLPPFIAVTYTDKASFDQRVEQAIRMTNNHDIAVAYGSFGARVLQGVLKGESVEASLRKAADGVKDAAIKESIEKSLSGPCITSGEALSETFGPTCECANAVPLCCAILRQGLSFVEAMRLNMAAGGDNCGRSIFLGSVLGAAYGVGTEKGVPLSWVTKLCDADRLVQEIDKAISKA